MDSLEVKPGNDDDVAETSTPDWKPLTRIQRRVAGVLVEKSKTTPDVYPMSLNGIKTGANQKSNRSPQMDLQEHQVEETLYQLRQMGAVVEVHSGGRVPKFKHQLYDWLAVDKAELAVMTELLLRGEQTIGELRARAARMEKSITGLEELRPVLASLKSKNLLLELTPSGRGQIVTHNLYLDEELDRLKNQFASHGSTSETAAGSPAAAPPAPRSGQTPSDDQVETLQRQVDELMETVAALRQEFDELKSLVS